MLPSLLSFIHSVTFNKKTPSDTSVDRMRRKKMSWLQQEGFRSDIKKDFQNVGLTTEAAS